MKPGGRLTEREAPRVEEAYARHLLAGGKPTPGEVPDVETVCAKYLAHLKSQAGTIGRDPRGVAKTFHDRGQTLFDFCHGLPGEFFCDGDLKPRAGKGSGEAKRIHPGFASLPCSELTAAHVDEWLDSHRWSAGGRRIRPQALKRALNFAVERRMLPANPLKGL
jgi:hypothetical protein